MRIPPGLMQGKRIAGGFCVRCVLRGRYTRERHSAARTKLSSMFRNSFVFCWVLCGRCIDKRRWYGQNSRQFSDKDVSLALYCATASREEKLVFVYIFLWKHMKFGMTLVSISLLLPPRGKKWSRRVPGVISGSIYALKVYLEIDHCLTFWQHFVAYFCFEFLDAVQMCIVLILWTTDVTKSGTNPA